MDKLGKTRPPYEWIGPSRDVLARQFPNWLRWRSMDTAEEAARFWQQHFQLYHFTHVPVNGWRKLAYELWLVSLAFDDWPERYDANEHPFAGPAELANRCGELSDRLIALAREIEALCSEPYLEAHGFLGRPPDWGILLREMNALKSLEGHFLDNKAHRKPNWRTGEKALRLRVVACRLEPLFEAEFGIQAKPTGGNGPATKEERVTDWLDKAKPWERFYLAVLDGLFGKQPQPGRMAKPKTPNGWHKALKEAAKPTV
jgi:hypothetical protein